MIEQLEKNNYTIKNGETALTTFYRLGKDHFDLTIHADFDFITSIKENIKILAFDLPDDLKEVFIPFSNAPVFWIYDSWLLNQIEEFMKVNFSRVKYLDLHKSIKENFTKWATTRLRSEREYYANLIINFIERDVYKHNFFKHIIHAIILTYHNSLYNPTKAIELYNTVKEIINTLRLSDDVKKEINYIINLFIGFVYLKEKDYVKANQSFKEAVDVKSSGITAKIYIALTELKMGNDEVTSFYIKEIISYDLHRLLVALDLSNFGMFNYFLMNAFINNIFYEKDFAAAVQLIAGVLQPYRLAEENSINKIMHKLNLLKEKQVKEYFTDDILKSINFFEKLTQSYLNSTNTLIIAMYPEFERKYNQTIDLIIGQMKKLVFEEIEKKLAQYDQYIVEYAQEEEKLRKELDNFHIKAKENLEKAIKKINDNYESEVKYLEEQIARIPFIERFNPGKSFSANMLNNTIIAFIVFIIGGLASYSNRVVADVSEFNSILGYVIFSGFKWGLISFIVGTFISGIIAGLVLIDRAEEKQRLVKRISMLKNNREQMIKETEEYMKEKERATVNNINSNIMQYQKRIEELKEEKEAERAKLTAEAEEQIKKFTEELESVR
ncbi:MAG: hypothetical protein WHS65_03945 [Melioribacteraceae bacterium]